MTDDTRARLREGIGDVVRFAALRGTVIGFDTGEFHVQVTADNYQSMGPLPPLTTAQQLALSVLVGEPDSVIESALCDAVLDQGHEYATACYERGKRDELERALRVVLDAAGATHRDGLGDDGLHVHADVAYVYDHIAAPPG